MSAPAAAHGRASRDGTVREISLAQARRIALAAQGFARPRPDRPVTMRDLQAQVDRLAQFQVDSVNVVARAHLVPLYSRLGPYDVSLLERASSQAPRRLVEYWGHAASLVDVRLQPALRFRMARAADEAWGGMRRVQAEQPELVREVLAQVALRGPVTARELEASSRRERTRWGWNWSDTKAALEWLFWSGQVSSAGRNGSFERRYDLPERVLPARIAQAPTPGVDEAHRELVGRAARALGVASERCLADYFRLGRAETSRAITELVAAGQLEPVRVAGWPVRTWLWAGEPQVRVPRRITARALVSPFDSLVFERTRARDLFGFDYTIEIYVPAERRRHGYYVYPFLLGERFCARVDLKAERGRGVLLVRAAWYEHGCDTPRLEVADALCEELHEMARWLGLAGVEVEDSGDLAAELAAAVRAAGSRA